MALPSPLRLRPLEIGDLLDETFRMYRRHFLLFAGLSIVLAIPGAALAGYSTFALLNAFLNAANADQAPDLASLTPTFVVLGIGFVLNLLLYPFTQGAVIYAACESALGRPVTLWGVLGYIFRRYFPILGFLLLIALMEILFCLFPLWIWIGVLWVAVLPAMFVEKIGLGAAMSRSWRLVEGRWWRTFLILFLIGVLWYVVRIALGAVLFIANQLLTIIASTYITAAVVGGVGEVIYALATPIVQIAIVLIYFDLRVRKEGLDLFQQAQRLPSVPQPA
jgi:hypothetical protein